MAIVYIDSGSFNSLSVTGSFTTIQTIQGTSSFALTASVAPNYVLNSATSSFVTTSSFNAFTSSINGVTGSYITTGSSGISQTISGSLIINQDLTVLGSSSITYVTSSQLNIGTNLITVNTATPAIRFGGLAVYDSGSTGTGRTGSMLWDSQNDVWVYSNPSGAAYDGAMILVGPRNSTGLGNEIGINSGYAAVGDGSHHMTSSAIYSSGSLIRLENNTQVTGSLIVSAGITGSLFGTASYVTGSIFTGTNPALSSSYASNAENVYSALVTGGTNYGIVLAATGATGYKTLANTANSTISVIPNVGRIAATSMTASVAFNATASAVGFVGTASNALTSSFINTLNQPVIISGSFTVFTGSAVEFQVTNTGVNIGNISTDIHNVTGSLNISGSTTISNTLTINTLTAGSILYAGASGLLSQNNSELFWNSSNNTFGIGTSATPTSKLHVVAGTLAASTKNYGQYVSATMPTSYAYRPRGAWFDITSAGTQTNNSYPQEGVAVILNAGYTGGSPTRALFAENQAAGTSTGSVVSGAPLGNTGIYFGSVATTTGTNHGVAGFSRYGDISIGGVFRAGFSTTDNFKAGAKYVGAVGIARNDTSAGSVSLGGYFGLNTSDPTYANAALIADNADTTYDIFVARDSGSAVFTIKDSGSVVITGSLTVTGSAIITGSISTLGSSTILTSNLVSTVTSSQSYLTITGSIQQIQTASTQVYGVNIAPRMIYTTGSQTQTAFRIAPTFSGSAAFSSSQQNIIADFGATSVGTQFSVNDITSGSIYMVNDVSGLPIIEALSDWTVNMYNYPTKVFQKSGSVITISGSLNISGSINSSTGSLTLTSGSVTMPNRSAFRVYGSGVTGISATTTISGSATTVDYNQRNNYDNTTGLYTAPIAGLYHVYFNCRTNSGATQQAIIYKNRVAGVGGTAMMMWETTGSNSGHFGVSSILNLAANDTLQAVVALGTVQFDGNDNWGAAYIG